MGLLDVYEDTITNPKPITEDYFKTRPKVNGMTTWYSYDSTTPSGELNALGYTTYKIPIIKKYSVDPDAQFTPMWDGQPYALRMATIKFTYYFDRKVLSYNIDKVLSVYGKNIPVLALSFKNNCLKEIGQLLEVDMLDIKPGRTFENIENIRDFELVIDGTKSILVNAGYYLPEF